MQIIKIRFYQLRRDLGFLFFVLLIALSGLSYFFFQSHKQVGLYIAAATIYLVCSFHKTRRDIVFVQKHFESPDLQIIWEYQLFVLPASVPCLFTNYFYCFFIIHTAVLLIPFLNVKSKFQMKLAFLSNWFKNDYIFISGVRRNFIVLVILFTIALLLSPVKLFPLVALFLLNQIIFSFYKTNESVQLLQSLNLPPKQFLFKLFRTGFVKMVVFNVPVLLVNAICNPDLVMFNLYFLGYNLLMLATIIVLKYSNYNHLKLENNFDIKLMIMCFGLFMPYLTPLTLIFYYQSRIDAIKNLKKYLDDSY